MIKKPRGIMRIQTALLLALLFLVVFLCFI